MRYAICNETFLDWPFDKAFAFARACGYTGIEIAPFTMGDAGQMFNVRDVSAERRREVRQLAQQEGLDVVGLHWLLAKTENLYLTSPEVAVRRATSDYLCELARLCGELGGSVMVLGSPLQRNLLPGVTHEQAMEYAADVLTAALPTCEACSTTIALEPLGPSEGDFLLTAADAIRLIDRIDSPLCRLHLDCKAMSTESQPIDTIIRQCQEYMVHFHANDANRLGPGMGEIDFGPIFEALNEVDYQGWVSVEVFDYTPGVERLARESLQYMQRVVASL
ncbi:MAG: sugar phosphate isomerase/epimerase family protein [Pirellulales bacterium]